MVSISKRVWSSEPAKGLDSAPTRSIVCYCHGLIAAIAVEGVLFSRTMNNLQAVKRHSTVMNRIFIDFTVRH